MCDASYLCQWEALERQSLSQVALLPHMDDDSRRRFAGPDAVRAEFDAWLAEPPVGGRPMGPQDELFDLLGVGQGRR